MHIFKINKGFEITSSLHKMLWPWLFINIHYLFIIYLSLYFSFIKSTRFLAIHCLILAWFISDQYMYNLFIPSPLSCLKFIHFTHYRSSLIQIYWLLFYALFISTFQKGRMLFFLQMKLRQQLQSIDSDQTIDFVEKSKRKQNLLMLHSLTFSTSTTPSPVANQQPSVSTMSPLAPAFYPPGDTVGSVVGKVITYTNTYDCFEC